MATIENRGGNKWRISQMYNGKRYRITIESDKKPGKNEARLIIEAEINKALESGKQQPKNRQLTFKSAADKYISAKENSLSPSTIRGYTTYKDNMPDHFSETLVSDITEEQLQQLVKWYQQDHSVKYTKNVIGFIRVVLKMFRSDFGFNVTFATDIKEEPYIPTTEEVKQIIDKAKGTEFEIPIVLAARYGLRRGEILALTMADLDEQNVLHINKAMAQNKDNQFVLKSCPKTKGSIRNVAISEDVAGLIRNKQGFYEGHPNSILRWLDKAEKDLGIQQFSFHKFRHYYCTILHENGIPDAIIMKLGGWSDPSVMQRVYRHGRNDIDMMKKAAEITAAGLI